MVIASTRPYSHPQEAYVEELRLLRGDRAHRSRLRCGHHMAFQSCQHRLGNAPPDLCLRFWCALDTAEHDMTSCPAIASDSLNHNITSLRDLRERPRDCINFIRGVGLNIGTCTGRNIPNMHMSVGIRLCAGHGFYTAGGARAKQLQQPVMN